jgi:DnaJ-class molecular chaperone
MAKMASLETCPRCDGQGVVVAVALAGGLARTKLCPLCEGRKRVEVEKVRGHFAAPELAK